MKLLNELTQKNNKFNWSEECENAFKIIKSEISSDRILVPFNQKLPLITASDPSPYKCNYVSYNAR